VTKTSLTRAAFIAGVLAVGSLAAAPQAFASRNGDAEQYVQSHATGALGALAGHAPSAQRRQTFDQLMSQFADMPRIANFVLGRYSASLRTDATLRTEWNRTFQDYAVAVYEDQLDAFSGGTLRVSGSVERIPGRDVIVNSTLTPSTGGRPTTVQWRLLRTGDIWKVVDVSLLVDGNQIWLAQQQQADFLARLDRSSGNVRSLIADVRGQTASMRQRIMARS